MTGRRTHQCHHDGCDSPAAWQIWLQLECVGVGTHRQKLQSESTIKVCNRRRCHKAALEFLLSPRNKQAIAAALAANGFPPPDFGSATAIMAPLSALALVEGAPGDLRQIGEARNG